MALSTNCWKYLVLTFNVLFAMSAVVLFGLSGFLIYRLFIYRHFLGVGVQYPAVLLLMMAIITCSVAWIGWRTAKSMHQIHVIVTGVLIALVVVIEFAVFVWAMVEWDNIEIDVKTTMTSYFMETNVNKQPNSADAVRWDRLHFECCGVTGPSDYSSSGHMPFSCCGQGPLDSLHKPYTADCATLYQRGCANQLHQYARQQLLWVALTALAASMLQVYTEADPTYLPTLPTYLPDDLLDIPLILQPNPVQPSGRMTRNAKIFQETMGYLLVVVNMRHILLKVLPKSKMFKKTLND
ncbi:23 kDa integral membrane protein-like isoform X2 [Pectinophora gossypiella]|uniref:23 kDa integral membrane protein-like isoform X2 n=1 Tax=Pectinophora gossypiella TaxID=13191 RepID=UPI00214F0DC6|nr:23 kDa integral membrane protein-like isoform X2 [Pectinophora gossypiella]